MLVLGNLSLKNKGFVKPLLIPANKMPGVSLTNPSIININNNLYVNLRNVNYTLYHSETRNTEGKYGPLCYLHPENYPVLSTNNIICKLNQSFDIEKFFIVDTSKFDSTPLWEFVGLEDARLIYWNNKLLLSGVRRDTTPNGQGRIELSEINIENDLAIETNRTRIPTTGQDDSYCEKNWMPILDKKFSWVKWSNPTEVVHYSNKQTNQTILKNYISIDSLDLRGGSQVIPYDGYYLAVVHESDIFFTDTSKKNADYFHRFILWDKTFNIKKISDRYKFLNGKIEFCCGLCEYKDHILITFGFQDNASFLLGCKKTIINEMLCI